MEDIDKILHNDDELNDALLIKYLEGNLSEQERFAVESKMADSAFINDAVEGLESIDDKKSIPHYLNELNAQLKKHTLSKKKKKQKRTIPDMGWIITTLVIILLLCIMGFFVLKMHEGTANKPAPTSISQ